MLFNPNVLRKRVLAGEIIEFMDANENMFEIWFQPKTNNFCLMMNALVVKATKTWPPIVKKLDGFECLVENVDPELFGTEPPF